MHFQVIKDFSILQLKQLDLYMHVNSNAALFMNLPRVKFAWYKCEKSQGSHLKRLTNIYICIM